MTCAVDKKSVIGGRQHLQRSAKDRVYAEGLLKVTARQALVSRMKGRVIYVLCDASVKFYI